MTKRATWTRAELERIMLASKNTGVPVEVDPETGVLRTLTPASPAEQMTDLQKWRAAKDARRAS